MQPDIMPDKSDSKSSALKKEQINKWWKRGSAYKFNDWKKEKNICNRQKNMLNLGMKSASK